MKKKTNESIDHTDISQLFMVPVTISFVVQNFQVISTLSNSPILSY